MDARLTAIHEAGHVVVRFSFEEEIKEGIEYVTIEPTEEALGHVKNEELHDRFDPGGFSFSDCDEGNRESAGFSQRELESRLSILLGGEAATYIETGKRDDIGAGREGKLWTGDFAACMSLIESIFAVGDDADGASGKAAYHYLEALFWRTVLLLRPRMYWPMVNAIAEALIEKRTLSAEQCRQIAFEVDPFAEFFVDG